jgi:mono/diheme cytochrome c family protein
MRRILAGILALATGLVIVLLSALFAWIKVPASPPPPDAKAPVEQGRRVFEELRCRACHSIAGAGSPRYPLDGVGSRLTREQITLWIVSPQEMKPGVAKRAYEISEHDLEALVDYLAGLRSADRDAP